MGEAEGVGMEELAAQPQIAFHAVRGVTRDREVDRSEMDADLVRATGLEPYVEECALADDLHDLEPRHGVPRLVRVERPPRGVATVAADGSLDAPRLRARRPADECEVPALDLALPDRALKPAVGLLGARHDKEARRVAV